MDGADARIAVVREIPPSSQLEPFGVFTRDCSMTGVSFLVAFQLFQDEIIRIALRSIWMRLAVVRSEKMTGKCYEIGARIVSRHDPGSEPLESLENAGALCPSSSAAKS
mgnify:CR=1 FL=1